jgi:hypothetical protein
MASFFKRRLEEFPSIEHMTDDDTSLRKSHISLAILIFSHFTSSNNLSNSNVSSPGCIFPEVAVGRLEGCDSADGTWDGISMKGVAGECGLTSFDGKDALH